MKHTRKQPLWYNPIGKDARSPIRENSLAQLAADPAGRALLESYCRLYRKKL